MTKSSNTNANNPPPSNPLLISLNPPTTTTIAPPTINEIDSELRTIIREEEMAWKRARLEKPKKRAIKPRDKFRFSFDWENTDTSRDINPLYQNPHEARLLFGRSFHAGMDCQEQKKMAANREELHDEICKEGIEEKPEEAAAQRLKEDAAQRPTLFVKHVGDNFTLKKCSEISETTLPITFDQLNP